MERVELSYEEILPILVITDNRSNLEEDEYNRSMADALKRK